MNGKRNVFLIWALVLITLTATGCKSKEKKEDAQQTTSEKATHIPPVVPKAPTTEREDLPTTPSKPREIKGPKGPAPSSPVGLENTKWVLTELMGKEMESDDIYLILDRSGVLSGFNGCDSFEGTYELKTEGRIEIGQMSGDPTPCPNSGNTIPFNQMLPTIDNFTIKNGILRLNRSQATTLLKFQASSEPST